MKALITTILKSISSSDQDSIFNALENIYQYDQLGEIIAMTNDNLIPMEIIDIESSLSIEAYAELEWDELDSIYLS